MKIFLIFLLLICIVIESTVVSFPFTLLCILLINSFFPKEKMLWAFFGGLLLDLFSFRLFGTSSFFFLIMMVISGYYQNKFHQEGSFVLQLIEILLFVFLYDLVFYRLFHPLQLVYSLLLATALLFVFRRFFSAGTGRRRLSV